MTDKAKKIVEKMRNGMLFQNPMAREEALDEFNRSTLDEVGPIGGAEQGMKVLQEMNELGEAQEQIIRDGVSKISVL
jgi:hypothetical protein